MKLAVVTGGRRRLGAAIAARLAYDGYALALHASQSATPDDQLRDTLEKEGTPWHCFAADLADAGATEALLPAIADHFGQAPDLLVNSAARFADDRPETVDLETLASHYAINCAAPAVLAKVFAAQSGTGGRAIVNILDQRIAQPHGDQFSYTLSKMALAGLTEILARELAPAIRVNGVAPGLTIPTNDYDDATLQTAAAEMPLRKLPSPAQVADAVSWLAGADAVTGQTIFVDGGAHMKGFARDFVNLG